MIEFVRNQKIEEIIPAKLLGRTDAFGRSRYSWSEMVHNSALNRLVDASPGRFGTFGENWAEEVNNVSIDIHPDYPPIVWLRLRGVGDIGGVYEFLSPAHQMTPLNGLWVVTQVCPIFEDDESGSGSGEESTPNSGGGGSDVIDGGTWE